MAKRIVEKKGIDGIFFTCEMSEVNKGDFIRMWEDPVTPVKLHGEQEFLAVEDAKLLKDGKTWGVNVEYTIVVDATLEPREG